MKVFVTGATGYVGSAVVEELLAAGHEVVGLARSDEGMRAVASAGAVAHRGSLEDPERLRSAASSCDGVIHTAFNHDFSNFAASCASERRAIEAIGEALAGSGRPFVVTSGTALLAPGRVATEADSVDRALFETWPRDPESAAFAFLDRGVNVSVVRLPPSVHGDGDRGFIPMTIAVARTHGVSSYVGEGRNRWAAVHRLDAARLFRLALESAPAGARLHAIGDEGVAIADVAAVIARQLQIPMESISQETANERFGFLARFISADVPASSAATDELLAWRATQPGLLAELEAPHYFYT